MIVVDASIAAKWFLDEQQSQAAYVFLTRFEGELYGPDLLGVEVCRAIVAAANARRVTGARARAAVDRWLEPVEQGDIPLYPTDDAEMRIAVNLAIELGHPLKDCIYLALADRLGCPLVTADVKFRDRVADPARVKLLEELI